MEVKAAIGMFLGLTYVAIGCFALHAFMDEKTWVKKSGATEMLEKTLDPACKDGKTIKRAATGRG